MTIYYDENQQQTRVLRTDAGPDTAASAEDRIGYTQPIVQKKKLFDGLSLAQVIAGAAAAATSLFLSSTIGIAGSVIGAAVSSVVTVLSSQIYRRALDAGAEKIKGSVQGRGRGGKEREGAARSSYTAGGADATDVASWDAGATSYDASTTRVAPDSLLERSDERVSARRASTQRRVAVFSVIVAVAAVALCAGAIFLGTNGEGLGEKTDIISFDVLTEEETEEGATEQGTDASSASETDTAAEDDQAAVETDEETSSEGAGSDQAQDDTDEDAAGDSEDSGSGSGTETSGHDAAAEAEETTDGDAVSQAS